MEKPTHLGDMQQVQITSDGMSYTSAVRATDGTLLPVSSVVIRILPGDVVHADITVPMVGVDILTEAHVHAQMECPSCHQLIDVPDKLVPFDFGGKLDPIDRSRIAHAAAEKFRHEDREARLAALVAEQPVDVAIQTEVKRAHE